MKNKHIILKLSTNCKRRKINNKAKETEHMYELLWNEQSSRIIGKARVLIIII